MRPVPRIPLRGVQGRGGAVSVAVCPAEIAEGKFGIHPGRGDGAVFAAAAREMELPGLREPISVHYGVCRDCGRELGSR